uniref:Small membrane A-kinase anchor protein n=1 Tax=Cyclopterus lumpus TaxID=8103 RepID=A0A8C2ZLF3_CYCLU
GGCVCEQSVFKPEALTSINRCDILQSMGCVKSKRGDSAAQNANSVEKAKAYLVHGDVGSPEGPLKVNPALLEYAQKLSEEIVARAVQQWVELDRRYCDIPYIESVGKSDLTYFWIGLYLD